MAWVRLSPSKSGFVFVAFQVTPPPAGFAETATFSPSSPLKPPAAQRLIVGQESAVAPIEVRLDELQAPTPPLGLADVNTL